MSMPTKRNGLIQFKAKQKIPQPQSIDSGNLTYKLNQTKMEKKKGEKPNLKHLIQKH